MELDESWRVLRERYATVLVDRLGLEAPLRDVAAHALGGGKRLRPLLAELLGRAVGAPPGLTMEIGIAVEYLHTASMLLDDLPCMDDARDRRGSPPAHLRFSEADAILTAVALVSRAYAVLLRAPGPDPRQMALLATSTVAETMAPGQALELAPDAGRTIEAIAQIHDRKTASLFALTGRLVATCAEASDAVTHAVVTFATLFGQAYQILDDIADRDEPGEARANLALSMQPDEARTAAKSRLAEARSVVAGMDGSGELGAFVAWLERSVDAA